MVNTPKTDHWQDVVLTDTGVLPGSYGPAQITVGADGRITSAANSVVSTVSTVSTTAQLPNILGPVNGSLANVLDDGFGNEEFYVWNDANADLGPPLDKWRRLATTNTQSLRQDYRQDTVALASKNLDTPIADTGIVKAVTVEIITPYSPGTSIEIQNSVSFVFMPFSVINPLLAGIYKQDLSGNLADMLALGSGQMTVVVGGAPGVGSSVVYIETVDI